MKFLKLLISTIVIFSLSSLINAKEIKMGKADWDTGYFQAEVYKMAFEKMGYKSTTGIEVGVEKFVDWFKKYYYL